MRDFQSKHSSAEAGLWPLPTGWEAWHKEYEEAKSIDLRLSLLYTGLTDPMISASAVIFYLKEADGHSNIMDHIFRAKDDRSVDHQIETRFGRFSGIGEARRVIAKTAFNQLVNNVFKDAKEKNEFRPSWFWLIRNEKVVDALLHFFRLDEEQRFVNLPSHSIAQNKAETVKSFLSEWTELPWKGFRKYSDRGDFSAEEKMYRARRMQFMDVLCGLGKLDRLSRDGYKAGEEELEKLTELALAPKHHFNDSIHRSESRRAVNVEEAAYEDSQAGKIAILLREKLRVEQRFRDKRAAELRIEEANKDLEKIRAQAT